MSSTRTPKQQAENQVNVRNGRDSGLLDRWLMRAARPGCKTTAGGADWSAGLPLGDTRGVRRDSGGPGGPKRGPEYERHPSTPEATGCRYRDGWSNGAALEQPHPQRPCGGCAHGGGPTVARRRWSTVQMPHRGIGTQGGCLREMRWLHGAGRRACLTRMQAHSWTWVACPRHPLAVGIQASPRPKRASPTDVDCVPRSGRTRLAAALRWAGKRGGLRVRPRRTFVGWAGRTPETLAPSVIPTCDLLRAEYNAGQTDCYLQAEPLYISQD